MQIDEQNGNKTEMFLSLKDWSVRMWVRGNGSPQERRQLSVAIFEVISRAFTVMDQSSWICHPDGYWTNIERDQLRGLKAQRGPDLEGDQGKAGFEIRMMRLKRGWTQKQLADLAGVSRAHLSHIEQGRPHVRVTTLVKIYSALGDQANRTQPRKGESKVKPAAEPSPVEDQIHRR